MKASDLPGELDSDYMILETRLSLLVESFVRLGEHKAKIEFFEAFREILREKEQDGDQIATDVLVWAYERLADLIAAKEANT